MRNRLALNIDLSGYDSAPEFVELIAAPDPAWHAYAEGRFDSIDAARAALGQGARK